MRERPAAADCATSGVEVVALLAEFESFTPAAWEAARDAVRDAVWTAAGDTTWDAVREAARIAVLATLARGLITPEQYETLMTPVEAARAVMRATVTTIEEALG